MTKRILRILLIAGIFAGSFFGTSLYIKSMLTQTIHNEFRYHIGSARFYATKQELLKFISHYLHAVTWAQRYEEITRRGGKR
ncbi:MAG: hypothetical protein V3U54_07800 [Thermodesulfobacteriota bacterium]